MTPVSANYKKSMFSSTVKADSILNPSNQLKTSNNSSINQALQMSKQRSTSTSRNMSASQQRLSTLSSSRLATGVVTSKKTKTTQIKVVQSHVRQ